MGTDHPGPGQGRSRTGVPRVLAGQVCPTSGHAHEERQFCRRMHKFEFGRRMHVEEFYLEGLNVRQSILTSVVELR